MKFTRSFVGRPFIILLFVLIVMIIPLALPVQVSAQGKDPCGVVDALDYPIDSVSPPSDDFGMYRAWFSGRHTGIDIAFDRYGDPVRAAARGRVTYADPKGWNEERGVVIIEHTFPDGSV